MERGLIGIQMFLDLQEVFKRLTDMHVKNILFKVTVKEKVYNFQSRRTEVGGGTSVNSTEDHKEE